MNFLSNINRSNYQHFPFHLVEPSLWPIFVSFALLNLTVGAVSYFHGYPLGGAIFLLGFILTLFGMIFWFRDIIIEGTYLGNHTSEVQKGLIIGFILFVISEIFAFLSVFWAYFHSSLSPAIELGSTWPPVGITALDAFGIPLLNTFILLSSGAFVTWSHHALIQGNRKGAIFGALFTVILAAIFTALQYIEYADASFSIADSVFGSVFYAATGLHGFHVIIGTIFIAVATLRIINYHFTNEHHVGYEASIIYWHFVDVIWLFLFISVYYWGGA